MNINNVKAFKPQNCLKMKKFNHLQIFIQLSNSQWLRILSKGQILEELCRLRKERLVGSWKMVTQKEVILNQEEWFKSKTGFKNKKLSKGKVKVFQELRSAMIRRSKSKLIRSKLAHLN